MKKVNAEFKPFYQNKNAEPKYQIATAAERIEALRLAGYTERAIDHEERSKLTGISKSTWDRMSKDHTVPKPFIGSKKNRWMLSEILVFMYRQSGIFPQPSDNTN